MNKKTRLILEIIAWSLAGILLVFVIVYYNFLVPEVKVNSIELYTKSPDFTLKTYDGDGLNEEKTYSLEDSLAEGKVVVLNFWGTTCDPCIEELPYFNRLKQAHSDDLDVIAIHSINLVDDYDYVQNFINSSGKRTEDWKTYDIIFAQDESGLIEYKEQLLTLYEAFGGKDVFPVTAIINTQGLLSFVRQGSFQTYEELENEFLKIKNHD